MLTRLAQIVQDRLINGVIINHYCIAKSDSWVSILYYYEAAIHTNIQHIKQISTKSCMHPAYVKF
jgi:hypothetical protein